MTSAKGLVAGFVLALAACSTSAALADWAYTHWGMTPEQAAGASGGAVKVLPAAKRIPNYYDEWELAVEGTYTDGPLKMPVGLTFDTQHGGLKCVVYNAMGDDVEALRVTLVNRYGKAHGESSFFSSRSLTWHTPDAIEFTAGQRPVAAVVIHCAPDAP